MAETEKIKKNVEKILKNNESFQEEEDKYLLRLETQNRPGVAYTWYEDYEVIKGKVEEIILEEEYDYPTLHRREILVVPLTLGCILYYKVRADYELRIPDEDIIYVFTKDGWKSLKIK